MTDDKPEPQGQTQLEGTEDDGFLTRNDILNVDDADYDEVLVPEWTPPGKKPRKIRIRTLTVRERSGWEQSISNGRTGPDARVNMQSARERMVMLCAVDGKGNKLFPSSADLQALSDRNAAAMERVFEACLKLSKIGPEAMQAAAGNSDATPSDNGFSDSA